MCNKNLNAFISKARDFRVATFSSSRDIVGESGPYQDSVAHRTRLGDNLPIHIGYPEKSRGIRYSRSVSGVDHPNHRGCPKQGAMCNKRKFELCIQC